MLQYLMLIVLVVRRKLFCDLIMIKQMRSRSCIFCQNHIHFFQNFNGTKGNVFEVADGCGNEVETHCPPEG